MTAPVIVLDHQIEIYDEKLRSVEHPSTHGTELAYLIRKENSNTRIVAVEFKTEKGLEKGLDTILSYQAQDDIPRILLMAFEIKKPTQRMLDTFEQLKETKMLVLSATGNKSIRENYYSFPRSDPSVILVGSHDKQRCISLFNNITKDRPCRLFALGRKVDFHLNDKRYQKDGSSYSAATMAAFLSEFYVGQPIRNLMKDSKMQMNTLAWKDGKFRAIDVFSADKKEEIIPDSLSFNNTEIIVDEEISVFRDLSKVSNLTYKENLIALMDSYPDNVTVPLSGGVDSEVVLRCAMETNKTVKIAIMRLLIGNDVYNQHDIKSAFDLCEEFGLEPEIYDLDIEWFLESKEYQSYCRNYFTTSYQLVSHLWLVDQTGSDFVVMPGDFASKFGGRPFMQPFKYFCYDYYNDKNDTTLIGDFLSHTSEIINSSIMLAKKTKFVPGAKKSYEGKIKFYNQAGFPVKARKQKYTGFEKVKDYFDQKHKAFRYVDRVYRSPMENMFWKNISFYFKR